jgi:hypothetical protein
MEVTYLTREAHNLRKMVVRKRHTIGLPTGQQQIRAEYLEIGLHLHATPAERSALEVHRATLQMRCTHPNIGNGMLPGDFNKLVAPNQCPDCGFVREGEPPAA